MTVLSSQDKQQLKKSQTGRLPIIELKNGVVICDSLPIAKYLARSHKTFLGSPDDASNLQVEMWTDYIS